MVDSTKLAAVFDAMADYIDQVEGEKTATVENARQARVDKIAAAHAVVYGEDLPEATRKKLATNDVALDYVEDLLSKQAGDVTPLGAGAPAHNEEAPKSVKQAMDSADERFVHWLIS